METVSLEGGAELTALARELTGESGLAPVHRLDRDTSGAQLFARHPAAEKRLLQLFRQRLMEKTYLALCLGAPRNASGVINRNLSEWEGGRRPVRVLKKGGLEASTGYRVLGSAVFPSGAGETFFKPGGAFAKPNSPFPIPKGAFPKQNGPFPTPNSPFPKQNGAFPKPNGTPPESGASSVEWKAGLLAFFPRQGRTHQIRVHAAALGHPVLGDDQYGDRAANREAKHILTLRRQALHAWRLAFVWGEREVEVFCPLLDDMEEALRRLGMAFSESEDAKEKALHKV